MNAKYSPLIPGLTGEASGKVFHPVDKPSGLIRSTLSRKSKKQSTFELINSSALTKHGQVFCSSYIYIYTIISFLQELAAHAAAEAAVRAQQSRV